MIPKPTIHQDFLIFLFRNFAKKDFEIKKIIKLPKLDYQFSRRLVNQPNCSFAESVLKKENLYLLNHNSSMLKIR